MIVESPASKADSLKREKPWWNRPLIGDRSLVDRVKGLLFRKTVVQEAVEFHDATFKKITRLSIRMSSLDDDKFGNKEFFILC